MISCYLVNFHSPKVWEDVIGDRALQTVVARWLELVELIFLGPSGEIRFDRSVTRNMLFGIVSTLLKVTEFLFGDCFRFT